MGNFYHLLFQKAKVFFAIDYNGFNNDTVGISWNGSCNLPTGYKCKHTDLKKVIREKRSTFKDDTFWICVPKPANIIYDNRTEVDMDCLCTFNINHSIWLLQNLYDTGDDPAVQI